MLAGARLEVLELLQQITLLLACKAGPVLILALSGRAVAGHALRRYGGCRWNSFGEFVLIGGYAAVTSMSRQSGGCQNRKHERANERVR